MAAEVVTVAQLEAWVRRFADLIAENRAYLTDLDSAIGDADHGINMDRGMQAVLAKLDATPPGVADELFKLVGMTLVSSIGGASGPLYGTFFLRFGSACGSRDTVSPDDLVKAFRAGVEGLVARAALAEVAGPALLRHHRDGVIAPPHGGAPGGGERLAR